MIRATDAQMGAGLALVTGAAGYLGGHLARALLAAGWSVRGFDLKTSKYVPPDVEFLALDMRDGGRVRAAVRGARVVFHLAFVQSMSRLPEEVRRDVNIGGTTNVVRAALDEGVSCFVHTSTIEVYGTRPPVPCPEEAPTDRPVGWYGRHKLEAERIVQRAHREQGLPVVLLRMPTICGPGAYNHRPLLSLMDRILDGKAVAVSGDGSTKGDFVDVRDVTDGYLLAAASPGAVGQVFNLSSRGAATHRELIDAMIRAVGSRSRVWEVPARVAGPAVKAAAALGLTELPLEQIGYLLFDNVYSIEKAKRLLGYRPRRSTAEAAASLIRGYAADRAFVRARSESY